MMSVRAILVVQALHGSVSLMRKATIGAARLIMILLVVRAMKKPTIEVTRLTMILLVVLTPRVLAITLPTWMLPRTRLDVDATVRASPLILVHRMHTLATMTTVTRLCVIDMSPQATTAATMPVGLHMRSMPAIGLSLMIPSLIAPSPIAPSLMILSLTVPSPKRLILVVSRFETHHVAIPVSAELHMRGLPVIVPNPVVLILAATHPPIHRVPIPAPAVAIVLPQNMTITMATMTTNPTTLILTIGLAEPLHLALTATQALAQALALSGRFVISTRDTPSGAPRPTPCFVPKPP